MALAVLGTELVHAQWAPGLWWGAAGGLAYALADFLGDYRDGFPEEPRWGLYLLQVTVRAILGAIVGAAALALGQGVGFVAGLAGPAALVALGAKFGRRKPRPGGKGAPDANDRPDTKPRTLRRSRPELDHPCIHVRRSTAGPRSRHRRIRSGRRNHRYVRDHPARQRSLKRCAGSSHRGASDRASHVPERGGNHGHRAGPGRRGNQS